MPQDAYTLKKLNRELSALLVGGKISKIIQPSKESLSLLIYTHSGTVKLNMDLSARFCRVSAREKREETAPAVAPNFCMLLRKHLQNAEITEIGQIGFERVIYFDFLCLSDFSSCNMRLYLEIMGKYSNAVLTKDGIIVGALKTTSLESAKRITLTGAKYVLPEKQQKADPTSIEELERLFATESAKNLSRDCGEQAQFLSDKVAGLAYVTALEIAQFYGGDITAKKIYDYVASEEISPCVIYSDGVLKDFAARSSNENKKIFPTLLEAQAAYYDYAVSERQFADEKRKLCAALDGAVKKCEKRLAQIAEKLTECEKTEETKLCGELVTANIYAIQRGQRELKAVNYYDPELKEITIKLDERLTPSQNAQRYYKRYAKLKRTAENALQQKDEADGRLHYLNSIKQSLDCAESFDDLKGIKQELISISALREQETAKKGAKKQQETPPRTYISGGFTVVCGRNNMQNDRLTKNLSESDVWLHVKTFHSSHVGIICEGKEPPQEVVKFAAEICAYYSEARQRDKVQVDFTLKKYVKRRNGAPLGFVTYTHSEGIIVAPQKHAEAMLLNE